MYGHTLYPEENMVLKCSGSVMEWRFKGQKISGPGGQIEINSVDFTDNG